MNHAAHPKHSKKLPSRVLVPLYTVRTHLGLVWLAGAGLAFVVLMLRSLLDAYVDQRVDRTLEVWGWFLPTVMPTLGMIIAVWGQSALNPVLFEDSVVRKDFFRLALALSVAYLVMILLTISMPPPVGASKVIRIGHALERMRASNLFLGPFQGLVASALGVLFVSKQKKDGNGT
jgi:hypothetical protein